MRRALIAIASVLGCAAVVVALTLAVNERLTVASLRADEHGLQQRVQKDEQQRSNISARLKTVAADAQTAENKAALASANLGILQARYNVLSQSTNDNGSSLISDVEAADANIGQLRDCVNTSLGEIQSWSQGANPPILGPC